MMRPLLLLIGVLVPAVLPAQARVLPLGVLASYGTEGARAAGYGAAAGLRSGPLYLGLRYTSYTGSTAVSGPFYSTCTIMNHDRTRSQVLAADVGYAIRAGVVEVIPGLIVGAQRYAQRRRSEQQGFRCATSEVTVTDARLALEPGIAIEVPVGAFRVIPDLRVSMIGGPQLLTPVRSGMLVTSVRISKTF